VFLGTLIPVAFLIILYIQSETRKAAMEAVSGGFRTWTYASFCNFRFYGRRRGA